MTDQVLVVCIPDAFGNPGGFDDNVHGKCDVCGVPIHWRPHNPPGRHVCLICVGKELLNSRGPEGVQLLITPKTAEEVLASIEADLDVEKLRRSDG